MKTNKQLSSIQLIKQLLEGKTSSIIIVNRSFFTELIEKIKKDCIKFNVEDK